MRTLFIFLSCVIAASVFSNNYTVYSTQDFLLLPELKELINSNNIDVSLIEAGVFHLTNQYRSKKKTKELVYQSNLHNAALQHAEQMSAYGFFSHTNTKNKAYRQLNDRADRAGYQNYIALSENLYYGYINLNESTTYLQLMETIVNSFIESKEHEANLLDKNLMEIGCGISFEEKVKDGFWQFYFVQNFGTRE